MEYPESPAYLVGSTGKQLSPWLNRPMVVAFSGGIDSTVLLHLLVELKRCQKVRDLRAIHVNHGLSPNAGYWAKHCQKVCNQWDVPFHVEEVQVKNDSGQGMEQAARSARYQVFERLLSSGDCLVQGHHQNDQAETLLFRLFRGTGIDGMAGIPAARPLGDAMIVRPLLGISRQQIEYYARYYGLENIEDESNLDQHYSRNYLRQSLLPDLEQRWPGVSSRLALLAGELGEVSQLLDDVVSEHCRSVVVTRSQWLLGEQPLIHLPALGMLAETLQKRVIRYWLKAQELPVPGREMLDRILVELVRSRQDAEPLIRWQGAEMRRYKDVLIASSPKNNTSAYFARKWKFNAETVMHDPVFGELQLMPVKGKDIKGICMLDGDVDIRCRQDIDPSHKVGVAGRSGRKTVKRWLQEYNIPPWLRQQIPFLFYRGEMVGVPGLWICDGFVAEPGQGYQVVWKQL